MARELIGLGELSKARQFLEEAMKHVKILLEFGLAAEIE